MTMLRFEREQRVGPREYLRSDGTLSNFFCLDTVRDLFVGAGFIEVSNFPDRTVIHSGWPALPSTQICKRMDVYR